MSEVRWGGNSEIESGDYETYFSGQEKSGKDGVGILIGKKVNGKLLKVEYLGERRIM